MNCRDWGLSPFPPSGATLSCVHRGNGDCPLLRAVSRLARSRSTIRSMPRAARHAPGGMVFHVLNRGNDRRTIFHKRGDALAFLRLLGEAKGAADVRLLAYCLMPNHWHLVLWPRGDGDLSRYVGWLSTTHVRRYRKHYGGEGEGHLYQGRFKSFPVQSDLHLLCALRYVEANPLRAGIVPRAEEYRWSSLRARADGDGMKLLDEWPVGRPENWVEMVNECLPEAELTRLRVCAERGMPYGEIEWATRVAEELGLQSTFRGRGRPPES